MGAYICTDHAGMKFPMAACPVVGCDTRPDWHSTLAPDPDWREKALAFSTDVPFEEPHPIETPLADADVVSHGGRDWIAHNDLIEAGYRNLEDFQVVRVRHRFYELQGHIGRQLTHGIKGGAWWVEEVQVDAEVKRMLAGLPEAL